MLGIYSHRKELGLSCNDPKQEGYFVVKDSHMQSIVDLTRHVFI